MNIPDNTRKCVAFVGFQKANGTFHFAGSAFFLCKVDRAAGKVTHVYLVTAKHVIDGIRRLGLSDVWVRMNMTNGESRWYRSGCSDWFVHPTDPSIDVAVIKTGIPSELDHLAYPMDRFVTEDVITRHSIGLGDEIFVVGLFRHHAGSRRNIPIVRIGNIASLSEEKVVTKPFGEIDAYLVEARSIGGLSGSPVLVNLGIVRRTDGQIKHASSDHIYYFLGLIHGHFDVGEDTVDQSTLPDDGLSAARVNTGIAIVVPSHKVNDVIEMFEATGLGHNGPNREPSSLEPERG